MSGNKTFAEQAKELFEFLDTYSTMQYYESRSKYVDVILSSIGIIVNILHFYILTKKELRSIGINLYILIICICDFIWLSGSFRDQFKKFLRDFGNPLYCSGYDSYVETLISLIYTFLSRVCTSIISSMIGITASIHAASAMFPTSSINNLFARTSIKTHIILLVLVFCTTFNFIEYLYTFTLSKKTEDNFCVGVANLSMIEEEQYSLVSSKEYSQVIYVINSLSSVFETFEPIYFVLLAVVLAVYLKIATSSNNTSRESSTSILFIIFLTLHVLSDISLLILPYLCLWFPSSFPETKRTKYAIVAATYSYSFKHVVAGSRFFVCLLLLPQYKTVFRNSLSRTQATVAVQSLNKNLMPIETR